MAEYDATNYTLTFKKIASINSLPIDLNHIVVVNNNQTVINMCSPVSYTHLDVYKRQFRFLSWLYSKSQGYIRYVIRSLFHLFGLNNGNKKISLKNKNLSDIF